MLAALITACFFLAAVTCVALYGVYLCDEHDGEYSFEIFGIQITIERHDDA